jgi:uncharacterized protein YdhG (YjbR/CyaY superfamily)
MAQSRAADVDTYLTEVPGERVEALTRLRDLCRSELTGFTEVMAYGMPAYQRDGTGEFAFASQKQHISLYLMRSDVAEAFADRLAGHDMGRGCLRFRNPARIDWDLVRDLLHATAGTRGTVC